MIGGGSQSRPANDNLTPFPSARLTVEDAGSAQREMFAEFKDLLHAVASGGATPRLAAVRYTQCRDALLEGALRATLPGFVLQCVSVYKFHEFICLYDAQTDARVIFLDEMFERFKSGRPAKRARDAFDDFDF